MIKLKQKTFFRNKIVTKKYLREILFWSFRNYGMAKASFLADSLKKLGFHFATQAGISISIEDLKVPTLKTEYIEKTNHEMEKAEFDLNSGRITEVERYQQLTDNWNMTSEKLKDQVVTFLKNFDPLNPIYMMAFSGARGNLSQVRQLIGIRGLMAGPSGEIIDIPITKNFREGLSTTDYMISAYGARKGLVDTALKTADSGYLTRRLIDVAQDILIRETECYTQQGIYLFKLDNKKGKVVDLKDRILGRILAKDVIHPISNKRIGTKNQQINPLLAKQIEESNLLSVVVRSPLTCQSSRSICKHCYGWNLSNGKLVDLGEAVGIIAAQSIGEPGTQLTMRTFHTGGIFSADSNYQIFSKVSGQIFFPNTLKTFPTRTQQGKNALIIEFSTKIEVVNFKNQVVKIFLKKDTTLFVNDKEFIKKDQLIASLQDNLKSSEKTGKKILFSTISGEIVFNKNLDQDNVNLKNKLLKRIPNGLIWILSANVFTIPFYTKITKSRFCYLTSLSTIGSTKIISYKSGRIKLSAFQNSTKENSKQIKLLIENFVLDNCKLYKSRYKNIILTKESTYSNLVNLNKTKFFYLTDRLKCNIEKYLTLGQLINNKFNTKISGIPYFLKIKTNLINRKSKIYNIEQGGGIFYLPEETFVVNKDVSNIFVDNGNWVESNTEIVKNIYTKTSGFVKLIFRNNIVNKIIVKSGYSILINYNQIDSSFHKKLFFKGEKIFDIHEIKQLTYSEIVKKSNTVFLLLRPAFLYELPRTKSLTRNLVAKISKTNFEEFNYTNFKNKDRIIIRDNNSIKLIKTELILVNTKKNLPQLLAELGFIKNQKKNFSLECNIFENIFSKKNLPNQIDSTNLNTSFFVQNNQYIEPYTVIGNIEFLPNLFGQINNLKERKQSKFRRILITLPKNYKTIYTENKIAFSKNFVTSGDFISNNLLTLDSGIIEKINSINLKLRLGTLFLFSEGAEAFLYNNDFIKENESLGVLFYKKAQTGDIVQGLPKIEEILEARKSKSTIKIHNNPGLAIDNLNKKLSFNYIGKFGINCYSLSNEDENISINSEFFKNIGHSINSNISNPHNQLNYLNYSYKQFLSDYDAAYRSLRKIQSLLLNTIQGVYSSQGVTISDKHLEIIIKQMTSKIKVKNRGESGIFTGEYIDLQQASNMNKVLKKTNAQEILYEPTLLGITKASLTNESFLSSSSFQETVRILSNAAIQGKVDWLRGLKENVIVGRLIPAGTGFNKYEQISHLNIILPKLVKN
jgi:DNA-directed RNA polymerase subunit beta'